MSGDAKPLARELVLVRGIACLAVVLLHAIGDTLTRLPPGARGAADAARMLLLFSTPTFVVLAAAVVGYAYVGPPPGFLRRRLRFVVVPFLVMGVVYAVFTVAAYRGAYDTSAAAVEDVWRLTLGHLRGESHLWFIIPIAQFYVLYAVAGGWLSRAPTRIVLTLALVVNVAYLVVLDVTGAATPGAGARSRALSGLWFPAWLFYFAAGHWLGRNLARVRHLRGPQLLGCALVAAAGAAIMLSLRFAEVIPAVTSRRADVLVYTVGVVPLLVYAASKLRGGARLLAVVSRYSFAIYILHPMFILAARRLLRLTAAVPVTLEWALIWPFATVGALGAAVLLSRAPFGSLLIGRPGRGLLPEAVAGRARAGARSPAAAPRLNAGHP